MGSDNGLSPIWRQAIIYTNDGSLSIGPLGTNFTEILIKILNSSFTKMHLKISSAKWRPFYPGGDELTESNRNFNESLCHELTMPVKIRYSCIHSKIVETVKGKSVRVIFISPCRFLYNGTRVLRIYTFKSKRWESTHFNLIERQTDYIALSLKTSRSFDIWTAQAVKQTVEMSPK